MTRDGNGDPKPDNPRVKTLLGCGYELFFAPTGLIMGIFFTHQVKRVRVHSFTPQTRYPMGDSFLL